MSGKSLNTFIPLVHTCTLHQTNCTWKFTKFIVFDHCLGFAKRSINLYVFTITALVVNCFIDSSMNFSLFLDFLRELVFNNLNTNFSAGKEKRP